MDKPILNRDSQNKIISRLLEINIDVCLIDFIIYYIKYILYDDIKNRHNSYFASEKYIIYQCQCVCLCSNFNILDDYDNKPIHIIIYKKKENIQPCQYELYYHYGCLNIDTHNDDVIYGDGTFKNSGNSYGFITYDIEDNRNIHIYKIGGLLIQRAYNLTIVLNIRKLATLIIASLKKKHNIWLPHEIFNYIYDEFIK